MGTWGQPRTVTPLPDERALQTRVAPTAPPLGSVGPLNGSQHGQVNSSAWGCSLALFNLEKEMQQ